MPRGFNGVFLYSASDFRPFYTPKGNWKYVDEDFELNKKISPERLKELKSKGLKNPEHISGIGFICSAESEVWNLILKNCDSLELIQWQYQ